MRAPRCSLACLLSAWALWVCHCSSEETAPAALPFEVVLGIQSACASKLRAVRLERDGDQGPEVLLDREIENTGDLPLRRSVELPGDPQTLTRLTATFTVEEGGKTQDVGQTIQIPGGSSGRVSLSMPCVCAGFSCPESRNCAEVPLGSSKATCVDERTCGDGLCASGEDALFCPQDCGKSCGDGLCAGEEDCSSCPADCACAAGGAGGLGGAGGAAGAAGVAGGCANCVPAIPAGFTGFTALHEGAQPPPCKGALTSHQAGQPEALPAQCSACSCGAPAGGTCSQAQIQVFSSSGCTGEEETLSLSPGCAPLSSAVGNDFFRPLPVAASGGGCQPKGGAATLAPLSWERTLHLCSQPPAGTCSGQEACAPVFSGYHPALCIVAQGDLPCPASYPNKTLFFDAASDTRGCSPCACSVAEGATCLAATSFFDKPQCLDASGQPNPISTANHQGQCAALGGTESLSLSLSAPSGGSCAPSGGAPVGSVAPATPGTLCCN